MLLIPAPESEAGSPVQGQPGKTVIQQCLLGKAR